MTKITAKPTQKIMLQEIIPHFNHVPLFVCICIFDQERHKLSAVDFPDFTG